MTMKESTAKALDKALDEIGLEHEYREDYSGRGMFGKTTHGIVVDKWGDLLAAVASVAADIGTTYGHEMGTTESPDEFIEEMRKIRWDSMGHSMIVY
jgi:gamma-glutamyltranspeptidase